MNRLTLSPYIISVFLFASISSFAHCDSKDGPVAAAAIQALQSGNINKALIWVQPTYEAEVKAAFDLTMGVRGCSPEAKTLAENYFFETLVRLHRAGEGIPYTGILPSGTPIDEKILAADKSVALGNLSPLVGLVPKDKFDDLQHLFDEVMSLKNYEVDNVVAGRKYIEAYVHFFHFAEGEEETHTSNVEQKASISEFPWVLSGVLFILGLIYAILYYKSKEVSK